MCQDTCLLHYKQVMGFVNSGVFQLASYSMPMSASVSFRWANTASLGQERVCRCTPPVNALMGWAWEVFIRWSTSYRLDRASGAVSWPYTRVLHDHVHHRAAAVHHGEQLLLRVLAAVVTGDGAAQPRLGGDHIAPGRGGDAVALGPQQAISPTTTCRVTENCWASAVALIGV